MDDLRGPIYWSRRRRSRPSRVWLLVLIAALALVAVAGWKDGKGPLREFRITHSMSK